MLYKTHLEIGENTFNTIEGRGRNLIDKRSFLKGNVLPDISPKYRLKKHGRKQFEEIIDEKVKELSRLSSDEIINHLGKEKFSIELGVICHFLCDFFSLPHDEEWGFKESVTLKHVLYEKKLHKVFSKDIIIKDSYKILGNSDYDVFFKNALKKYRDVYGHRNDLFFAMYLNNSVVRYVLESIEENDKINLSKEKHIAF
ncbi:zinc dependent phospholipase C family protein [Clostridium perfringens]|uniref:zinc dependent phospholipase C family protein n=1 Tax=Clostridium perfringens TaxID=1502 RepID=UPI001ABB8C6F|nr:zinc dependent phospholipase C family protein [Clostridium perfringens]MBO3372914.1 zinc dependent phospholipase C family protein [Clostridium perfringens]